VTTESDRVMFEIYRESGYDRLYRVVYYTELSERNRDLEIGKAMAGEHLADGFIALGRLPEAKSLIKTFLDRLNAGEKLPGSEITSALAGYRIRN
jgi:hypothetical protein